MHAQVIPVGNLANQMLQLVFLESLRKRVPELELGGVDLPLWNIHHHPAVPSDAGKLRIWGQFVDFDALATALERGWISNFEFGGLGFRIDNYLPVETVRRMFAPTLKPPLVLEPDELLINVRGAEILGTVSEHYGPMPIAYLQQLAKQTGLKPVLMGQIGDDWYSHALRDAFAGCKIVPSHGVLEDFEILRNAHHIAMSLSTFSWMGCWLSSATTIHMPLIGIFNPLQRPEIDLIPLNDPRYRFYDFPVRFWTASDAQIKAVSEPGNWPLLSRDEVSHRLKLAREQWAPWQARYRRSLWTAILKRKLGLSGKVGVAR